MDLTKVTLTWHGDSRFVGLGGSGAPVLINFGPGETAAGVPSPAAPGGRPEGSPMGPMPTELLLIATGACTGLDVISILQKKRVAFTGLEIEVTGQRAEEHPKYFTEVEVVYRLRAEPDAQAGLERAAELSMDRYCSVGHSLRARPTWRCEVEGVSSPRG
jgi:putative redox protein